MTHPNDRTDWNDIAEVEEEILAWAKQAGFKPGSVQESSILFVSEAVEMMEEDRSGHDIEAVYYQCKNKECAKYKKDEHPTEPGAPLEGCPECGQLMSPEGVGPEVADLLIRVLHWTAHHEAPIRSLVRQKMQYNWTRSLRNGGKAY